MIWFIACLSVVLAAAPGGVLSGSLQDAAVGRPASVVVYSAGLRGKQTVVVDKMEVAVLEKKRYFTLTLPPGQHEFSANGLNEIPLKLMVEAGKTYYICAFYSVYQVDSANVHLTIGNVSFHQDPSPASTLRAYKPVDAKNVIEKRLVSVEPLALLSQSR